MSKEIVKYLYFNLSGVYNSKTPMVDLTDISGTNCYCDDVAGSEICRRIDALPEIPPVRFIDSGNYHYMSLFFMRKITVPFTLLLLDNHPDTKLPVFGNITSCGGWVREASETIPNMNQVIMAGVDSDLIEEESPLPERTISVWLSDLPAIFSRLETPLYISLDKDIMNPEYARTDWTQGPYTLEDIISILKTAYSSCDVIGLDICGEKKEDPTDEDLLINDQTNQKLLEICE